MFLPGEKKQAKGTFVVVKQNKRSKATSVNKKTNFVRRLGRESERQKKKSNKREKKILRLQLVRNSH